MSWKKYFKRWEAGSYNHHMLLTAAKLKDLKKLCGSVQKRVLMSTHPKKITLNSFHVLAGTICHGLRAIQGTV